jgi:hypothetical protein
VGPVGPLDEQAGGVKVSPIKAKKSDIGTKAKLPANLGKKLEI